MSDVTASYGKFFDLVAFFWVFSYIIHDHSCLCTLLDTQKQFSVKIEYLLDTKWVSNLQ